jgi:signal transduction histidine kinase
VVDRGRIVEADERGAARRVMGITADVTQARRAEAELREVEALSGMGRVAARVAHEINNPLAGIRNAFALIKDAVPLDHPHRHYVGAIEREVDRIGSVIRQLYEVYRPEQEPGTASLATITRDAVALLEQVNRAANVEFHLALDEVPSVVPVSGGLLRQIVYNLVQNAVDASPAGGTVDVLARVEDRELVVEVHDQGPGVPVELRERIFEPFFTTKDASVRTGGMGLGLSMVARSVAAARGTVTVDDAPSGGARFVVRLPLTNGGAA